jgi:hypothetical protein
MRRIDMSTDKFLTKEYIYDLIVNGYCKISDLSESQRKKLISVFVTELSRNESIFEDQEPGKQWLSNFIDNPEIQESAYRLANEISDCILFAHRDELDEYFEEMVSKYHGKSDSSNDYEDWIKSDNRSRYVDSQILVINYKED